MAQLNKPAPRYMTICATCNVVRNSLIAVDEVGKRKVCECHRFEIPNWVTYDLWYNRVVEPSQIELFEED